MFIRQPIRLVKPGTDPTDGRRGRPASGYSSRSRLFFPLAANVPITTVELQKLPISWRVGQSAKPAAGHLNAANAVSIGNPVETDPELVAAVAFVSVGVCADESCGEAQRYTEDRSPRLSPGQYKPVTAPERFKWFVRSTVGPSSLFLSGPLSASLATAINHPEEYGHIGLDLGNGMECG